MQTLMSDAARQTDRGHHGPGHSGPTSRLTGRAAGARRRYGGYSEALQAADDDIMGGEAGLRSPPSGLDSGGERSGLRSRMSARDQATRERIREGMKGFGRLMADTWKARLRRCLKRAVASLLLALMPLSDIDSKGRGSACNEDR